MLTAIAPPGVWPVMLTPFGDDESIDLDALDRYTEWLIARGAVGLFPVALSGEMYELTLEERLLIARRTVAVTAGRVPVAAAALGDGTASGLAEEVVAMSGTGVDIVVLVVPTILGPDADEATLFDAVDAVIAAANDVVLGIYECPLPHHRLLSLDAVARLAQTGRFAFFKETSHDVDVMADRVRVASPHGMLILNAGIENLAESLRVGVAGLSGWVANVAPDAVADLIRTAVAEGITDDVLSLQAGLTEVEQTMGPTYPSSAKAIVDARSDVAMGLASRWRPATVDAALVATLVAKIDELA